MTHTGISLITTYDLRLVILSVAIAAVGSYIALDLARQVAVTQGRSQKLWLMGGALTLGISIWAMHFIGMLAYQLPLPATYDFSIVFVSMAVAVAGSGAGLFAVSQHLLLNWLQLSVGGLFVGLGIVGLHFAAMASMQIAALPSYDPKLIVLSTIVAIGCSSSALWLAFHRVTTVVTERVRKLGSTALMGVAIAGMHYTAMAAVSFRSTSQLVTPSSPAIDSSRLAVAIGIATLILLILTLFATNFSRRLSTKRARAEALRQSEDRFRSLVQNASDIIAIVTAEGTVSYFSLSIKRILGYEPQDWLAKPILELVYPKDITKAESLLREARRCPAVNLMSELRLRHANSQVRDFEVIINNLLAEPSVTGIVATGRDITERKQAEEALRQAEAKYRSIFENAVEGIFQVTSEGRCISANPALARIYGYESPEVLIAELTNINQQLYVDANQRAEFIHLLQEHDAVSGFESQVYHQDGSVIWISENALAVRDERGELLYYEGTVEDISQRKRAEEQLVHDALHDALTGLPNRNLLMNRLSQAITRTQRWKEDTFAVLFLDLDRFKVINDSLGHLIGDQLLVAIAQRLTTCLRTGDTIARLSGDEFAMLLECTQDLSDAISVAERIQRALTLPFNLNGYEIFTTASIGVALSTTGYNNAEDVLRDADIAMYHAKTSDRTRYAVFNTAMRGHAMRLLQLENDLRRAMERQEFQLHYQPIVALATGQLTGFEALLRWQHPQRGLVFPTEFLTVAEETGLIISLGAWVLRQACSQLRAWQDQFPVHLPLTVSINLCNRQFAQPNLIPQIKQILHETCLDPSSLRLEITEGVITENSDSVAAKLLQLRNMRVLLSIDDFGTGYSSLSRLHHLPIDTLKIDRSFVSQIEAGESLEIVRAIVTLAHNLDMEVTAEGVETAQQLASLQTLGCEYGQGYFFSQAVAKQVAEGFLAAPQWLKQ